MCCCVLNSDVSCGAYEAQQLHGRMHGACSLIGGRGSAHHQGVCSGARSYPFLASISLSV